MSATYEKTDSIDDTIADLIETKTYHRELHVAGVTVQVLFHFDDRPLLVRGWPAHAYVKVTNLKERALDQKDATIVVCKASWDQMDDRKRIALVDHELYHLQVCKDPEGRLKTDDLNRPKLRLRKHDIEVGWFVEIAKEHGPDSIECEQANGMVLKYRQSLFAFALEAA